MSFWRRFGGNPFWSFGLPFTVMVLGGMYVLTEIRSERYSVHSKFGDNRRIKGHELNSLEQDVEELYERTKVVDDYEMKPVIKSKD